MANEKNCELCTDKCPQAERAHEAAAGRMYATKEFIALQKKVENGQLVEVVHCKDCVYFKTEEWHNVCLHAEKGIVCPEPTDFCSYGRKSGTQPQRKGV